MFDPINDREMLLGDCGLKRCLGRDLDGAKAVGGLASSAHSFLNFVVNAFIVGEDDLALKVLEKALHWVETSLVENEIPSRYFPDAFEAERFHTLAMAKWLLRGEHDGPSLERIVYYEDQYLTKTKYDEDKASISLTLVEYADAGAYERALELFEKARFTPPKSLGKIRGEAKMVYVLARHHLGQQYTAEEVGRAARSFLTANMDAWLAGHGLRAAEWLKIVYWNDASAAQFSVRDVLPEFTRQYERQLRIEVPAADPKQAAQEIEAILAAARMMPDEFGALAALSGAAAGEPSAADSLAFLAAMPVLGDSANISKLVARAGKALDAVNTRVVSVKQVLMRAYDHLPGRAPPLESAR